MSSSCRINVIIVENMALRQSMWVTKVKGHLFLLIDNLNTSIRLDQFSLLKFLCYSCFPYPCNLLHSYIIHTHFNQCHHFQIMFFLKVRSYLYYIVSCLEESIQLHIQNINWIHTCSPALARQRQENQNSKTACVSQ